MAKPRVEGSFFTRVIESFPSICFQVLKATDASLKTLIKLPPDTCQLRVELPLYRTGDGSGKAFSCRSQTESRESNKNPLFHQPLLYAINISVRLKSGFWYFLK